MNNLQPVFMKLEKVPCLDVGGGKIALQKIHQLIESKAMVTVVSPEISEVIHSLAVTTVNRCYLPEDLDGVRLVVAATDNNKVNRIPFVGRVSIIYEGIDCVSISLASCS